MPLENILRGIATVGIVSSAARLLRGTEVRHSIFWWRRNGLQRKALRVSDVTRRGTISKRGLSPAAIRGVSLELA